MKKLYRRIGRKIKDRLNEMAFYLSGNNSHNKASLEKMQNRYEGRRCFVICNGPSLRPEDLTKIYEHGDISIGINLISHIYDKTPWRPTILVATDDIVYKPQNKKQVMECEAGCKSFSKKKYLSTNGVKGEYVFMSQCSSRNLLDNPKFSMDSSEIQYTIGTSAYEAIEWAVYLGSREIYIIGCDMSYANNMMKDGTVIKNESGKNHFYAMAKDVDNSQKIIQTWELQTAFDAAEKFSREYGFRIYNATRGGFCESFERVEFDKLF